MGSFSSEKLSDGIRHLSSALIFSRDTADVTRVSRNRTMELNIYLF